jgi:hypothetical protein
MTRTMLSDIRWRQVESVPENTACDKSRSRHFDRDLHPPAFVGVGFAVAQRFIGALALEASEEFRKRRGVGREELEHFGEAAGGKAVVAADAWRGGARVLRVAPEVVTPGEAVANLFFRENDCWIARVFLDFLAQRPDRSAQRLSVLAARGTGRGFKKPLVGNDSPAFADEMR